MERSNLLFKAVAFANEININKLANHFGIKKNFQWEDNLRLSESQLSGIVKESDQKRVILFSFGSAVFSNFAHHEIVDFINYIKSIDTGINSPSLNFADDYTLKTGEADAVNYDSMSISEPSNYHIEILATVLAKSVALEAIESEIEILLDEIEVVISRLRRGQLQAKDEKQSAILAQILNFKLKTISSIMILDKPDITWNNESAEKLYYNLSHMFELDERYSKVSAKTGTLMDIVQVFTSLTQHKKANTLEWMIVILILFEIIFSLTEFFLTKLHLIR